MDPEDLLNSEVDLSDEIEEHANVVLYSSGLIPYAKELDDKNRVFIYDLSKIDCLFTIDKKDKTYFRVKACSNAHDLSINIETIQKFIDKINKRRLLALRKES